MAITVEQAQTYLKSQGIDNAPDFIVQLWVDQINSIQACLDENYDASTAALIQFYLLAVLGLAQVDKYISSQTAPSGASRSFRYNSFADRWNSQLNLLRGLDTAGCTTPLIPADPLKAHAGLWIGKSRCGEC
jgi:hypothetical protein